MRWLLTIFAAILIALAGGIVWQRLSVSSPAAHLAPPRDAVEARQRELLEANVGRPGDPELLQKYQAINTRYFSGALPAAAVRWEPGLAGVGALAADAFTLQGMFGKVGNELIVLLNPDLKSDGRALDRALSHEMVHVYLQSIGDTTTNHGPAFKTALHRLAAEGAFEGIDASDADKASLRVWLDAESARIDSERQSLETDRAELERDRRSIAPDRFNQRAIDLNARIDRNRDSIDYFNREVARYNLMIAYPDGLDEEAMAKKIRH